MTTKLTIKKVRLSYAHLFEPYAHEEEQEKKYSAVLLIPKTDKQTVAEVKNAILEAYDEALKGSWQNKKPAKFESPLRDGDEKEAESFHGCYYLNAKSNKQPQVLNKQRKPIIDNEEVYSGCYGAAAVSFYAYNKSGNKGVGCGLSAFMKTADGERLGDTFDAEAAFADIEIDDDDDILG